MSHALDSMVAPAKQNNKDNGINNINFPLELLLSRGKQIKQAQLISLEYLMNHFILQASNIHFILIFPCGFIKM